MTSNPRGVRRWAALLSLVCLIAAVVLLAALVVRQWPAGLVTVTLLALAVAAAWQGLIRGGAARALLWGLAALLLIGALALSLSNGVTVEIVGVALLLVALAAGKRAYSIHVHLPSADPPKHAVVIWNPRSGGGKALRDNLADEARARGIEPIELKPGDDLVALARDAVARGADGLAAAGGDGTQAIIATIAAEHNLPFACIPAGTRNHFALDLGVDRDDVVGALDAFVSGGEKRVDLGDVNGRTFVNNVSLGLYAESVQQEGYRDAKIRTILATAPAALGRDPGGGARASTGGGAGDARSELRWTGPDGVAEKSAAVILVSNNPYRLGRAAGSGTRPRMDTGQLGVAAMGAVGEDGTRRRLTEWPTPEFVVESDGEVPVGVDGEALMMAAPLTFRVRPGVLRVRIAPQHPGASPSAAMPAGLLSTVADLVRVALGADLSERAQTSA